MFLGAGGGGGGGGGGFGSFYQGTALLFLVGALSGWSGGITWSSGLVSSGSMAPFNSQFTSVEEIRLSGWSSRRCSGGGTGAVEVIATTWGHGFRLIIFSV